MNETLSISEIVVFILPGLSATLAILVSAVGVGLGIALIVGVGALTPFLPLRIVLLTYVEIFRGTSFLVQLFYFYYVLPLLGVSLSPFWVGTLALGLNAGAYGAEIVRGAFLAIPVSQREAIVALNIKPFRAFYRLLLPQAATRMVLPMGNFLIEMIKSTPLLALVSIPDLLYRGQMLIATNGQAPIVYGVLLAIYLCFGLPLAKGIDMLNAHVGRFRAGERV